MKLFTFMVFFRVVAGKWPNKFQKQLFKECGRDRSLTKYCDRNQGSTTFLCVYALWKSFFYDKKILFLGTHYAVNKINEYKWYSDLSFRGEVFASPFTDYRMKARHFDFVFVDDENIDPVEYNSWLAASDQYACVFSR